MYRFQSILFSLLFLSVISLIAQQDEEDPLPPKRTSQAKIGGAGGFTQNLLFLNLDPINEILRNSNAAPFKKNPIFLLGGQGYGYIMVIPNLRIGGAGAGGSMVSEPLVTKSGNIYITREVEFSVGCGGVTIEYAIPIFHRLDISAGILLGGGGLTLKIMRDEGNPKIWNQIWDDFADISISRNQYIRTLSGSFFVYQPTLNIEYSILRWLGVRFGVSYSGMAMADWKLDDKHKLIDVPANINGSGWMINSGIFLGTFIY
ncbi:MAG: hypothetical protein QME52_06035 [Bacteroidota bacterium]|nr:hypothetical protein [Bacteroidota bacterium]